MENKYDCWFPSPCPALAWCSLCFGLHKHGADGKGDPKEEARQSACTWHFWAGRCFLLSCPYEESSRYISLQMAGQALTAENCWKLCVKWLFPAEKKSLKKIKSQFLNRAHQCCTGRCFTTAEGWYLQAFSCNCMKWYPSHSQKRGKDASWLDCQGREEGFHLSQMAAEYAQPPVGCQSTSQPRSPAYS